MSSVMICFNWNSPPTSNRSQSICFGVIKKVICLWQLICMFYLLRPLWIFIEEKLFPLNKGEINLSMSTTSCQWTSSSSPSKVTTHVVSHASIDRADSIASLRKIDIKQSWLNILHKYTRVHNFQIYVLFNWKNIHFSCIISYIFHLCGYSHFTYNDLR